MRRFAAAAVAVLSCALLLAPAGASAASRGPKLAKIRCVPVSAASCRGGVAVRIGKQVQLSGTGLKVGMRVTFRWSLGAIATKLHHGSAGWVARVPPGVRPGTVQVYARDRASRKSNVLKLTVLADVKPVVRPAITGQGVLPDVFHGNGMWIWQLQK